MQDAASVKRSGVAYYKAISPAGTGKAPWLRGTRNEGNGRSTTKSRETSVETSQFDTGIECDFQLPQI